MCTVNTKTFFLFAVGITAIASCWGRICVDCDMGSCEDPGPCEYGETTDDRNCCPVCYKGPGEECGTQWSTGDKFIGYCASGMTCAVKHSGEVGTCMHWEDERAWMCGECDPEKCEDPGPCEYGDTTDDCRCCPVCYKGPGEDCGSRWKPEDEFIGYCAGNMTCVVKRPGEKRTCIDWEAYKAVLCGECNLEKCEDPGPCEHGDTTDDCDCCPVCYKGPGEECGQKWYLGDKFIGYCAPKLFCS